ncbi:MAG: hypothetical protein ACYSWQ_24030, partial [Planctomycetota bacterium]
LPDLGDPAALYSPQAQRLTARIPRCDGTGGLVCAEKSNWDLALWGEKGDISVAIRLCGPSVEAIAAG